MKCEACGETIEDGDLYVIVTPAMPENMTMAQFFERLGPDGNFNKQFFAHHRCPTHTRRTAELETLLGDYMLGKTSPPPLFCRCQCHSLLCSGKNCADCDSSHP